MTINDLSNKAIMALCKKYNPNCVKCPLSRWRKDDKGNEHELFCFKYLRALKSTNEKTEEEKIILNDEDMHLIK